MRNPRSTRSTIKSMLVDLRDVTTITSRGIIRWIDYMKAVAGKGLHIIALPEALLFQATTVAGLVAGATIESVLVPFECPACGFEERRELNPEAVLTAAPGTCPECRGPMRFAGLVSEYEAFLESLKKKTG